MKQARGTGLLDRFKLGTFVGLTAANWLSLTNGTDPSTQDSAVARSDLSRASPWATVSGGWILLQSFT